ncbi:MAG: PilN domain-containing protein [Proteobacteria bacterium]|nr:PilN domain-containing protein [Pseudomonadota bacterium]
MTSVKNQYSLFGLDLAVAGRYFVEGWREAAQWPVFRWMNPRRPVRVLDATGQASVRLGRSAAAVDFKGPVDAVAVELPEDLVLRRSLVLPQLSDADLEAAVALDARGASPFPEADLVWGFSRVASVGGQSLKIESVLSSRALIGRHLDSLAPLLEGCTPEVWAGGSAPIALRGFGDEAPRKGGLGRAATLFLVFLTLVLIALVALTPLLQLREQTLDAIDKNERLLKAAAPQAALRADLMRFNANLDLVGKYVAQYPNALLALDELSRLLPDDVLVNTLEFKGDVVRVSGQAANAAKLLDLLASQPGYVDVKAPSATTRVQGSNKEYFTIEFKIRRGGKVS